jgi:hypothetical protein
MKIIVSVLFTAALLCGCQKHETPKPAANKTQQWEYKTVEVENYAHGQAIKALYESETNLDLMVKHLFFANSHDGSFEFSGGYDKYSVDLYKLGSDGWELIAAVPQLETEPNAQYENTRFNNTRTGKIILIFKRPK